jgi:hypothetical protein
MKKLIAFFGLICLIVISTLIMGAASGTSSSSKTLSTSESWYAFTPTATQYLGGVSGKDTLNFDILANKTGPCTATAYVDVASRKGTTDTYSFDLQGKVFTASTYASVYKGTGKSADYELSDTTLITEVPLGKFYRYFRVQLATDNSCATTDSMTFTKIYIKVHEW